MQLPQLTTVPSIIHVVLSSWGVASVEVAAVAGSVVASKVSVVSPPVEPPIVGMVWGVVMFLNECGGRGYFRVVKVVLEGLGTVVSLRGRGWFGLVCVGTETSGSVVIETSVRAGLETSVRDGLLGVSLGHIYKHNILDVIMVHQLLIQFLALLQHVG